MPRAVRPYEGPALAFLMVGAGLSHFLAPRSYEQIVPHVLGDPGLWVRLSGVVEIGCGALVALPGTRRLGAWLSAGVLVAVFPANVQMALDGGLAGRPFPLGSPVMAWLRLPLQVPLVVWACRVAVR
ncbi:MAG: DoxX family protein [Acidimicrobiales bacterium]